MKSLFLGALRTFCFQLCFCFIQGKAKPKFSNNLPTFGIVHIEPFLHRHVSQYVFDIDSCCCYPCLGRSLLLLAVAEMEAKLFFFAAHIEPELFIPRDHSTYRSQRGCPGLIPTMESSNQSNKNAHRQHEFQLVNRSRHHGATEEQTWHASFHALTLLLAPSPSKSTCIMRCQTSLSVSFRYEDRKGARSFRSFRAPRRAHFVRIHTTSHPTRRLGSNPRLVALERERERESKRQLSFFSTMIDVGMRSWKRKELLFQKRIVASKREDGFPCLP